MPFSTITASKTSKKETSTPQHTEDSVEEPITEPDTSEPGKKPKQGQCSGVKKKQAGKGNLIIQLFITISNNNAITLILNNEMIFNTKTINIHKVLTITFL